MPQLDLFRLETQKHVRVLIDSMLSPGRRATAPERLDECVQALRSIRTAAHTAGVWGSHDLARAMETWFVTARQRGAVLRPEQTDLMRRCAEMLDGVAKMCRDVDHVVRIVEQSLPGCSAANGSVDGGGSAGGTRRVLVVDDELEMRELAHDLLHYRGYSVDVAVDGIDAWNAIRSGHFDLVVTDIDMPLLDGLRLTELIKENDSFASISIVVICDDCDTERLRLLQPGADRYVPRSKLDDVLVQEVAGLIGPPRS